MVPDLNTVQAAQVKVHSNTVPTPSALGEQGDTKDECGERVKPTRGYSRLRATYKEVSLCKSPLGLLPPSYKEGATTKPYAADAQSCQGTKPKHQCHQ